MGYAITVLQRRRLCYMGHAITATQKLNTDVLLTGSRSSQQNMCSFLQGIRDRFLSLNNRTITTGRRQSNSTILPRF